ncbi:outer membrane beta-barrel protein [Helicobacter muridarum]|uniref:Outer membrane beta-barrel protein n=1 Tax=Helicobacter muridarum TaxID=216 RepID=A0A099TYQ6_9HELI|nr:outer membrane beta-barrel protein [Helicobacter muridarum]TLD98815.1 outer membrane beta-barrel protein [Helicobacter muridarum]STQ85793.1 outer membrane protein [Helicobacter muridarum]
MKQLLVGAVLACSLLGSVQAAEDNGFFIGISAGGGASFNIPGGSEASGSSAVGYGARLGYQAFFSEYNGVRFYLSGFASHAFYPSAIGIRGFGNDLYVLGDINSDYLFNWVSGDEFSAGLFVGFFSGALISRNLGGSTGGNSIGITAGLNLGLRTIIADHHQIEFGFKSGFNFFIGQNSSTGAVAAVLTTYSYKF